MRKVIKGLFIFSMSVLLVIVTLIITFIITSKFTYKPITYLTKKGFDNSNKSIIYPRVENFQEILLKVDIKKDLEFSSKYKNNKFDLITPKNIDKPPVLFWIHGGAFVGGDKIDTLDYLITLAEKGYAVININYELAPNITYPTPIKQVSEAVKYIYDKNDEYNLDLTKVFIGGDSAGAQIAGQFTNIQMNKEYSKKVGIEPCIKSENIKGYISFSGLLNMVEFNKTDSWLSNLLFHHAAWAYFKDKNWIESPLAWESSIIGNILKFPPTFITDGNLNSFENQGKELYKELIDLGIPAELNLYDGDKVELKHEYQFNMDIKEARDNFNKVVKFLDKYKE